MLAAIDDIRITTEGLDFARLEMKGPSSTGCIRQRRSVPQPDGMLLTASKATFAVGAALAAMPLLIFRGSSTTVHAAASAAKGGSVRRLSGPGTGASTDEPATPHRSNPARRPRGRADVADLRPAEGPSWGSRPGDAERGLARDASHGLQPRPQSHADHRPALADLKHLHAGPPQSTDPETTSRSERPRLCHLATDAGATDFTPPITPVLGRLSDRRVQQYWIRSTLRAATVQGCEAPHRSPNVAIETASCEDLAAVYPAGLTWEERLPPATIFSGPVIDIASTIDRRAGFGQVRPRSLRLKAEATRRAGESLSVAETSPAESHELIN